MNEYLMTFDEFIKRFLTDEQCEAYFYNLRWGKGFVCPKCGNNTHWKTKRLLYTCIQCQYQVSTTAGTIFQDSRKRCVFGLQPFGGLQPKNMEQVQKDCNRF